MQPALTIVAEPYDGSGKNKNLQRYIQSSIDCSPWDEEVMPSILIPGITPTNMLNRSFSSHHMEQRSGTSRSALLNSTLSAHTPKDITGTPKKDTKAKPKKFVFTGITG